LYTLYYFFLPNRLVNQVLLKSLLLWKIVQNELVFFLCDLTGLPTFSSQAQPPPVHCWYLGSESIHAAHCIQTKNPVVIFLALVHVFLLIQACGFSQWRWWWSGWYFLRDWQGCCNHTWSLAVVFWMQISKTWSFQFICHTAQECWGLVSASIWCGTQVTVWRCGYGHSWVWHGSRVRQGEHL